MKSLTSLLILSTLLILSGCATTPTPSPSGHDSNIRKVTNFVEQILPTAFNDDGLSHEILLTVMSEETLGFITDFRRQKEESFGGSFDEYRVTDYDIARRRNTNVYVSQVRTLANIGTTIIVSELLFIVQVSDTRRETRLELVDFRHRSVFREFENL